LPAIDWQAKTWHWLISAARLDTNITGNGISIAPNGGCRNAYNSIFSPQCLMPVYLAQH